MFSKKELYNALKNEGEVIVFSNEQEPGYFSTIFWFSDRVNDKISCFCRSMGILPRDEMNIDSLYELLLWLFKEGFHILLRGMDH